jgi:hypothetical protein
MTFLSPALPMRRGPLTRIACGDPTSPRKRGEVNPLKPVRETSLSRHSVSARSSNAPSVCCESQYFPGTALRARGEVGLRPAMRSIVRCNPGEGAPTAATRLPWVFCPLAPPLWRGPLTRSPRFAWTPTSPRLRGEVTRRGAVSSAWRGSVRRSASPYPIALTIGRRAAQTERRRIHCIVIQARASRCAVAISASDISSAISRRIGMAST